MKRITVPVPVATLLCAVLLIGNSCSKRNTETEKAQKAATVATTETPSATPKRQSDTVQTVADTVPVEKKEPVTAIGDLDKLTAIIEGTPGKLLVFDLYADWCVPCKILAPLYDSLAVKHGKTADFYRVNVQYSQDIAAAFGVRGIPFVVFMKDKKVVQAITGLNPVESYERVITTCGGSASISECQEKLGNPM